MTENEERSLKNQTQVVNGRKLAKSGEKDAAFAAVSQARSAVFQLFCGGVCGRGTTGVALASDWYVTWSMRWPEM